MFRGPSSCSALLVRDVVLCCAVLYRLGGPLMRLCSPAYACLNIRRATPAAEESGAGKQILLERGAYKDMDVCIMYVATCFPLLRCACPLD